MLYIFVKNFLKRKCYGTLDSMVESGLAVEINLFAFKNLSLVLNMFGWYDGQSRFIGCYKFCAVFRIERNMFMTESLIFFTARR